ncbi:MAG: STAS domain-containing protein [Chlorobiota bacterium]
MSNIKVNKKDNYNIIELDGKFIGGEETDALRDKLIELKDKSLILDLVKVSYLNSTALGVLLSAQAEYVINNNEILIVNSNETVENLLNLTQLSLVFTVLDSIENAEKKLINNYN